MSTKPAIVNGVKVGEFYTEVCGYWKFVPKNGNYGYWDEYMLMNILCKLRKLNIEWDSFSMTDPRISDLWKES